MKPKKIKVVHITSSLKIGGAEHVLYDLIHHLDSTIFEHQVIFFHDGPVREKLSHKGITLHYIKGGLFRYDPLFFMRLYYIVKKINPDGIHTLLWSANVAGRVIGYLLGIPVVSAMHNNIDQDGIFRGWCDKLTLAMTHKVIAVSDEVAQSIIVRDSKIQEKIIVIKNGIDIATLHASCSKHQLTRKSLGLDDTHFVIGSVGRFVDIKRYDLMLESFALLHAKHSNVRLVLVGVGPCLSMLQQKASTLGITETVIFIIGQPASGYYPLFDCFSMSSDKEGVSLALLEAMSFTLPCVVTHSQKHTVLDHKVNGLIVPAGNCKQLAQAWQRIMHDPELAAQLADRAYSTVSMKFDHNAMIKAYMNTFKQSFKCKKA